MNSILRKSLKCGLSVLSLCGVTAAYRRKQEGACILMYHGLSAGNTTGMENYSGLHLDLARFRQTAKILAKHYNVISLHELAARIKSGAAIPNNSVVLTFDDGYASNYHLAFPILKEFGLQATIFASTAFIEGEHFQWPDRIEYAIGHTNGPILKMDFPGLPKELNLSTPANRCNALLKLHPAIKLIPQERHLESIAHIEQCAGVALMDEPNPADIYQSLSWDQLRELEASDYVSIGAHTHNHSILGKSSSEFARQDMERCMKLLRGKGGVESPTFAYPNGKVGDYNETTREILSEFGITVAVTTEMGFNEVGCDSMELKRMGTPSGRFEADTICSGLIPKLKMQLFGRLETSV